MLPPPALALTCRAAALALRRRLPQRTGWMILVISAHASLLSLLSCHHACHTALPRAPAALSARGAPRTLFQRFPPDLFHTVTDTIPPPPGAGTRANAVDAKHLRCNARAPWRWRTRKHHRAGITRLLPLSAARVCDTLCGSRIRIACAHQHLTPCTSAHCHRTPRTRLARASRLLRAPRHCLPHCTPLARTTPCRTLRAFITPRRIACSRCVWPDGMIIKIMA